MRQLHIREPWADLAIRSSDKVLDDLLNRIQILEDRVRELELRQAREASAAAPVETKIPVRTREAVPVGI